MRLLTETAKREAPLEPGQLAPLENPLAMLQENPLAGLVMRPDLPLPQLREVAKRKVPLAIRRLPEENPLAESKWQTVPTRLQDPLAEAK